VHAALPLDRAREALLMLPTRSVIGKLVVAP
jgi:hypothetical protein